MNLLIPDMNMQTFGYNDITAMGEGDWEYPFFFKCAMISTCSPVFDSRADNYDVRDILIKVEVIVPENEEDSESCALMVNFKSQKDAEDFIDRLNKFLQDNLNKLKNND